jgi:hypothetical protein
MTKSFLIAAGCLLVATAAWAGPPPGPQGSGNNVSAALNPPATAPQTAAAPATEPAQKPQIGIPGSGNNVSAALATPAPAAKPAPQAQQQHPAASAQAAQAASFNAGAYTNASDCMTAASAAHQPLNQCETKKK